MTGASHTAYAGCVQTLLLLRIRKVHGLEPGTCADLCWKYEFLVSAYTEWDRTSLTSS